MTLPPLPEWAPHEAVWIGFPSDPELWLADLIEAEREVAAFAKAVHAEGKGEQVWLVAAHEDAADKARELAPFAKVIVEPFGDIWLRDSGPIVVGSGKQRRAQGFRFNGWGNKYDLEGDQDIGERIANEAALSYSQVDWVLEGGAIDHDGSGTVVTTEQCLLNPNRNPGATHESIEGRLEHNLGFERVIWLGDGLLNDHTDGHVDNLARFVAPGTVAIPVAWGRGDPNAPAFDEAARRLSSMTDARGEKIKVVRIPSPGWVEGDDGRPVPASHMNFLIANKAVIVPIYEQQPGEFAVQVLKQVFPDREVIGLRSTA